MNAVTKFPDKDDIDLEAKIKRQLACFLPGHDADDYKLAALSAIASVSFHDFCKHMNMRSKTA